MESSADRTLDPEIFNSTLFTSILSFWLSTYPEPSSSSTKTDNLRWFGADPAVDEKCRAISAKALEAISPTAWPLPPFDNLDDDRELYSDMAEPFAKLLDAEEDTLPRGHAALALALLLDQMPRNNFRGAAQPVVYTHYDRLARAVTTELRGRGLDHVAAFADAPLWRIWFFLPLMHSEDPTDHQLLRASLSYMLERTQRAEDKSGEDFVKQAIDFEEKHVAPLEKFGRYPWRNQWLGRQSTPKEEQWLREGGDRFGTS